MNKTLFILSISILILLGGVFLINNQMNEEDPLLKQSDPSLEKYRSEEIPEACRLPGYESDPMGWKEHLSHHKDTLYCLEYYSDVRSLE